MNNTTFAAYLVRLYDEQGIPLEMLLETVSDHGGRVPLLALLMGMIDRGWGRRKAVEVVKAWGRIFAPTDGERAAIECLLSGDSFQ